MTERSLVGDELERVVDMLAERVAGEVRDHLRAATGKWESPIEHAVALAWRANQWSDYVATGHPKDDLQEQVTVRANGRSYRVDFIYADAKARIKLVVETDGHEFHERTREQVEHRNTRDANLQSDGWFVLHFSGRQVMANPHECVCNIDDAICDLARRSR